MLCYVMLNIDFVYAIITGCRFPIKLIEHITTQSEYFYDEMYTILDASGGMCFINQSHRKPLLVWACNSSLLNDETGISGGPCTK